MSTSAPRASSAAEAHGRGDVGRLAAPALRERVQAGWVLTCVGSLSRARLRLAGGGVLIAFEGGEGAGPLANNIGAERTAAIRAQLGLKEGDAAFFVAGDPEKFWKFSGLARTKVAEELNLIDKDRFELAWIVDFPMYEYNEELKKIEFSHNPFSMPQGGLEALETQDPLTIKAFQYDITCNGYEIASGGIRNHKPEAMVKAFEIAGYGEKDVVERFARFQIALGDGDHLVAGPDAEREQCHQQ